MPDATIPDPNGLRRIKVDSLTPGEKSGLKEQGYDIPSEGFVDLDVPDAPVLVDPKADERKAAVNRLKSVGKVTRNDEPVVKETQAQSTSQSSPMDENDPARAKILELEELLSKHPTNCQHCGWHLATAVEVKPTPEDIESFLRAVLGGETYSKEYVVFGGRLHITFRTRSGLEEEGRRSALRHFSKFGDLQSPNDFMIWLTTANFVMGIARLGSKDKVIEFESFESVLGTGVKDPEKFQALVDERLAKIPSHVQAVARKLSDEFVQLVDILVARAQDPGFWNGSAASP